MQAWTFQDRKQLAKLGDKCPWSVGWYDPDGKRKSKSIGSKSLAEKYARKIEGQLAAGVYRGDSRKSWEVFVAEYEAKILANSPASTQRIVSNALDTFQEIARVGKVATIRTQTIDDFIVTRRQQTGRKGGDSISPATVNKELRCIKAALRVAHEWGYLPTLPKVRMMREAEKLVRFVTQDHFAAIYKACDVATFPHGLPYPPADWWRALLTFAYMTGWRIGECLALRREDLDLEGGRAITRAADNKGKRDESMPLHPLVVDHLRPLASFQPLALPWPHHERTLWVQFDRIQTAAGIHLDCPAEHEHTPACHLYGFHDLRRGFATLNAPALTADALQRLMRHRSYLTTQRYINMADQLTTAVEALHVPAVLKAAHA